MAASLRDETLVRQVYSELIKRSHTITYDWAASEDKGIVWDEDKRREVADLEIRGVAEADVLVFLVPGGRGAHVEMGVALGFGIPVLMCYKDEPKFSLFYHDILVTKFPTLDPETIAAAVTELR